MLLPLVAVASLSVRRSGTIVWVEAVIDKDLAGERLALDVGADIFVILTDVSHAILHYNTPSRNL